MKKSVLLGLFSEMRFPVLFVLLCEVLFGFSAKAQYFNLYVSNYGLNQIEEFNSQGQGTVFAKGHSGSAFVSSPEGMAFDNSGNLYVANGTGVPPEVLKINSQGSASVFANPAQDYSMGLAIDANNNVYVGNTHTGTIEKYAPNGNGSVFASVLGFVTGLAFDYSGNLYVANASGNDIIKINAQGSESVFARGGYLSFPCGLAFDAQGNLYVANETGFSIEKINPAGQATLFAAGGNLSFPEGIAVDPDGNVFVANFGNGNSSIEEFDAQGDASIFAITGVSQPSFIAIQSIPEASTLTPTIMVLGLVRFGAFVAKRYQREMC
jgi:sugar lactone lactonase YvrE